MESQNDTNDGCIAIKNDEQRKSLYFAEIGDKFTVETKELGKIEIIVTRSGNMRHLVNLKGGRTAELVLSGTDKLVRESAFYGRETLETVENVSFSEASGLTLISIKAGVDKDTRPYDVRIEEKLAEAEKNLFL